MRALQMTSNKGAPQGWVQDGMYLATWSLLIQYPRLVYENSNFRMEQQKYKQGNMKTGKTD